MRIPQSGLRIDEASWPLLQAQLTYWLITSADGNAFGTTLVCADLVNFSSYVGLPIKILSGPCQGQVRLGNVSAAGTLTVASAFTNAAGAVQQIVAGTRFVILSQLGGDGGTPPAPPSPGVGLWMFGECAPDMAASTTVVRCPNLAGLGDDLFNTEFYMQVIHNADAPGVAPEPEIRQITDYVSATGEFTAAAFTANVEANDCVCIVYGMIYTPSVLIQQIFDLVNAILVLTETGGTVTATAPGTEDNIYINDAPAGVFRPIGVMLNTSDLAGGETVIVRTRYRTEAGGALEIQGVPTLFAGVQAEPMKYIELKPNRFGVQVTIEGTAGVVYVWEVFYKG